MSEIAKLYVSIGAKTKEFQDGMKGVQGKMQKVGKDFQKVGKNMTKYVTLPIVGAFAAFGKAAMDLEATEAKYNTVFEGMTDTADQFIKDFQQLTPATTAEARSMASGIQDLLVPMGFMRDEATDITGEMMHLTGALANFNSGTHSAADVANAMQSALLGQYKPLASLGIQLDVNTVKQKAVEKGMAETTGEVDKQMMAQIMLEEAYEQSGDALEAYTEENLDAKTKMGLMKAELIDVAAQFGQHLLPIITKVVDGLRKLVDWFSNLTEGQQKTILTILAVVAAVGPLLIVIGKIITLFATLAPFFAAIKAGFLILLGPIGLVVAAVAAVIAIGVLLYKNWDKVKERIGAAWEWIQGRFASARDRISGIINRVIGFFVDIPKRIKNALSGVVSAITGPFSKARDKLKGITDTAKGFLNRFNPFSRSSPSLVDNVKRGMAVIEDEINSVNLNISPVAHQVDGGSQSVNHTGKITVEGVNSQGELVGIVDIVMDKLADQISSGDRRISNRASIVPG